MSTATDEQVAVIRRGWMGTAGAVAPDVAGLTDFMEDRLVELESRDELTENGLLAVVEAASQMVLASGSADQARDTSRRMRRTVYEFLLALDASTSDEAIDPEEPGVVPPNQRHRRDSEAELDVLPPPSNRTFLDGTPELAEAEMPGEWEGIGRRAAGAEADTMVAESAGGSDEPLVAVPRAGFHLTDPVDLLPAYPTYSDGVDEPAVWTEALEPWDSDPEAAELLAPDEGGDHMETGVTPNGEVRAPAPAAAGEFEVANLTEPEPAEFPLTQTPAAWSAKVGGGLRPDVARFEPSLVPDVWGDAPEPDATDTGASADVGSSTHAGAAAAPPAWRIRKPELAGEGDRPASSGELPSDSWQSPEDEGEPPPDLRAPRREIDDLLRRKKYDQTGAVLQQLAQDRGGRAVAELALDIGDRCRAMGKRMAATSCYLAASRAEPVFEEPLSRLADVCIDDRDIDLAVSYLERVARLTRVRGDVKGALRVYRRIHAIAPYRDDILDLLMRAQSTGRLDP